MKTRGVIIASTLGLGLTAAFVCLLGAAPAGTIVVDVFYDGADGTCGGEDCTLREAILAANVSGQPDTIVPGEGVYSLTLTSGGEDGEYGDLDVAGSDALTITGLGPDRTVIDANGIDRVLYVGASVPTLVISGVTVTGGDGASYGGGIYAYSDHLVLVNAAVVTNSASARGGGVYLYQGVVLQLTAGSVVGYNTADDKGGGVYVEGGGGVALESGEVVSNTADSDGGGVYLDQPGTSLTQTAGTVVGYNTAQYGGGVYANNGGVTLSGGWIVGNTAGGASGQGGGVYVNDADASFHQSGSSTVTHNAVTRYGGGVYIYQGRATLSGG